MQIKRISLVFEDRELKKGRPYGRPFFKSFIAPLTTRYGYSRLMCRTEQVKDSFHRVERFWWDLDKDGVPASHSAIP